MILLFDNQKNVTQKQIKSWIRRVKNRIFNIINLKIHKRMTNSTISEESISILILVLILLTFGSCQKSVTKGDIEGIIFFSGTNIPVNDVKVEAGGVSAFSKENGSYRIEGIETGTQTLSAERTGFIPFSTEITVQEGSITVLIPMQSPVFTFTVQGVITGDFTGDPQPGLTVVLLNPDGSESDIFAVTDSGGNYQLHNVPFGERTFIVKSSNSVVSQNNIAQLSADYELSFEITEPMVLSDARDGKNYDAKKIGDQIWMVENLAYLPLVSPSDWGSDTLALYYVYGYQGTDLNQAIAVTSYSSYGVLYNWTAAKTACPEGWHLPNDDEWKQLEIYLGMEPEDADLVRWRLTGGVGKKLKSDSGWDSNGNGNNYSGFNAIPGGFRAEAGNFGGIGTYCNFWTASMSALSLTWNRFLSFDNDGVSRYGQKRNLGFSVRCLKDD